LHFAGHVAKICVMAIRKLVVSWLCAFVALLLLLSESGAASVTAETAEWVARQADNREVGRDGRFDLKMRLFDRQQRVRERDLTILTMRPPQPAGGIAAGSADRVLIRFTYPNDIKGTAFLVWEHPDAEDERFLYLPALGRVRRIAGAEAQDSFVGSDFAYEDISGREINDYTYSWVEQDANWNSPDGQRIPAYRIESRAKNAQARFPRIVSTIRKDNFVVVHADIHNRRNELQKIYDVRRLDLVQSIWTLSEIVMTNAAEKTHTELVLKSVRYNTGLTEADFSRRELERK
jgi:outer membrane lipoprotein-sorting protein